MPLSIMIGEEFSGAQTELGVIRHVFLRPKFLLHLKAPSFPFSAFSFLEKDGGRRGLSVCALVLYVPHHRGDLPALDSRPTRVSPRLFIWSRSLTVSFLGSLVTTLADKDVIIVPIVHRNTEAPG